MKISGNALLVKEMILRQESKQQVHDGDRIAIQQIKFTGDLG